MSLRLNNIDPLELELCFISSHLSPEKIIEALSVGIKDDSFQIDRIDELPHLALITGKPH